MNNNGLLVEQTYPLCEELKKYRAYERLVSVIFGESRLPLYYPYIIEDGEEISLEEGVKRALNTLPDKPSWTKENQICLLNLRFGLEDGRRRTLAEIGKEFGVPRERIHQVEKRTLRMLRHPSRSKPLKKFLIPAEEFSQGAL